MHQKIYIILFLKVSYIFRPCRAIFGENNNYTLWLHLYSYVRMCRGRVRDASQSEDEAQGTFALNYINATIVYQYYSP
jgi:hypothetical protein